MDNFNLIFNPLVQVGCQRDEECPTNRACIENQCVDPCYVPNNPCGDRAVCEPMQHRAVCHCPPEWAGNPHIQCYQCRFTSLLQNHSSLIYVENIADECKVNADCPLTKACVSQECVDPCLTTSCGTNAQCQVDFHTAKCVCRPGLQGNPYVKCLEVECRLDTDCGDRERCDRSKQECVPLCVEDPCALGATCEARNHKEYCTCNPPLQGDGYVSCTERKRGF